MTNPWILLFAAGLLEIVWAGAMKASDGFTKPVPSILTGVAVCASFWLLSAAMRNLPLGTSYGVWVGIGVVGTGILGMVMFGEDVTPLRIAGVILIVAGIAALKLA